MRRTVSRAARLSPSIYLAAIRRTMNTTKGCKTPLSTNRVREEHEGNGASVHQKHREQKGGA
jgi:hypothetical protein